MNVNFYMAPLSTYQKILTLLILIVIVFFSLFRITESPPFGVDEGWVVQVATNIAESGRDGLQFAPGEIKHVSVLTSVGYTLQYPLALWFKIFGSGIFQARLMMATYMLVFAIISFVLIRRLYGNIIALSTLSILATFPPFYSFGKSVIGEVPVLFFLILFLLLFDLATSQPKRKIFWLILCGIAAGLCVVTKTMALAFIPILFIGAFIAYRKRLVTWNEIVLVIISTIIPIVVWIIVNFQPGDSLASVMDYYTNPSALTDKSAAFWLSLKILFTRFGSLFTLLLLAIWGAGVIVRLKDRTKVRTEEWVALLFSVLLLFSLLFRYVDARYLFPIQALGILFAPFSAYYLLHALPDKFSFCKKVNIFAFGVALLSLAGLYQLSFNSYVADSYQNTITRDLSEYFSSIPSSTSVFFYNSANVVPHFQGKNYYQRIAMFEKWIIGNEFESIARNAEVDMLVINLEMSKADEKVPLDRYTKIAEFGKIRVLEKNKDNSTFSI